LGKRITDDIVSQCHQCGKPCDVHTNCLNEGCHLLLSNVSNAQQMEGCCSKDCIDVTEEEKTTQRDQEWK
jgi:UPF0176 protein